MYFRLAALSWTAWISLLLAPLPGYSADLKLLGEACEHKFVTVESDKEGPWLVLGPNAAVVLESKMLFGTPVLGAAKINKADSFPINGSKGCKFVGPPGHYAVTQWVTGEEEVSVLVVEVLASNYRPPPVDPVDPVKPPPPPPKPVTAVSYIYEKDETVPPTPVLVAFDKLNREKKIVATTFDDDTVDGTGQTPAQYTAALAAARVSGLPALVVMSGTEVVRVVKDPRTAEAVTEAIK